MVRLGLSLALLAVLVSATACALPGGGDAQPARPTGCGSCESETADVRARIAQVPQVRDLTRIDYTPGKSTRLNPTLTVDLDVAAESIDPVRVAVVKAAWLSRIAPLDHVIVNLVPPDGQLVTQEYSFLREDETKVYRREWGPRPVAEQ